MLGGFASDRDRLDPSAMLIGAVLAKLVKDGLGVKNCHLQAIKVILCYGMHADIGF